MSTLIYAASVAAGISMFLLIRMARGYTKYRGVRVITCPETRRAAGVVMDAWHAAATMIHRTPGLRLQSCTRWPERAGCGQECIRQIEAAPESCLLRNILARWYLGKNCALCKERFAEVQWADHKPALMSPQGVTMEWRQVAAAEVFGILDTHQPVCWRCHITRIFCREHPDLVLDRSRAWPPRV
jgi:hypothetical protein